jgi:hypothetical protein
MSAALVGVRACYPMVGFFSVPLVIFTGNFLFADPSAPRLSSTKSSRRYISF